MGSSPREIQKSPMSQAPRPVVLIIDDDADTLEELSELVRTMGYPVRKASDPSAGLALLMEARDIGIVLIDLRMPRLDGLSLAARFKGAHATTVAPPFIFMSGMATIDDTVSAIRLDAADFLVKPIEPRDLARALARANDFIATRRRDLLKRVDIMRSVEAVASHAIKLANELAVGQPSAIPLETLGPVFTPRAERGKTRSSPDESNRSTTVARDLGEHNDVKSMDDAARNEFLRNRITALIATRRARSNYFESALFSDPCWDMLLDLMKERLTGREVSVSSLCIAAGVPQTTGLRRIDDLVRAGLLVRREDPKDRRRVFVDLADTAIERLNRYINEMTTFG